MKYFIRIVSFIGLFTISQFTYSSSLNHTFATGDTLEADHLNAATEAINDNDTRITAIEGGATVIAIDCSADANAFLNTTIQNNITYTLTGMCNGPIWVEDRKNVTIQGDATGSKDDGVILQAGLTVQPYAAIGVWQSRAITLDNLTVSAANYVSETYVFGDNVSALHVGNDSYTEVSNVDFIGGDYSVHTYNDGQLVVRSGVTVTGFNLGGLTAYNHGLIRTLNDITVTGLVGTSTDDDPAALQATNNSIVEIRNGGAFAGPTTNPVQEYRTTVWAGDNGTVRIKDGTNPTVVTGGVLSTRSATVRIDGNTTVTGYIAAYHLGYTRIAGTTQSGGLLEVGDGAMLRFDSSVLAPTSIPFPAFPVDVYRMGKFRTNDTSLDLGGNDISLSGFGYINLRGTTDLGGADINCHDRRLVSIKVSVTNVGTIGCVVK